MNTKDFYRKQDCVWQTNIDEICRIILVIIFEVVARSMSDARQGEKILDMGCGRGDFIKYKPAQVGYIGIDISEKNIKKAKEKYPKEDFRVMDATDTTFEDGIFDYIVCIETMEHLTIDELRNLLKEMKRIGKKNCKIVITTPNLYYLWGLMPWSFWPIKRRLTLKKFIGGIRKGYADENYNLTAHHYRFSPSFLRKLFRNYFTAVKRIDSTFWYNNRAIHGILPRLQMKILNFSNRHKFLGLDLGAQLVIEVNR